MDFHKDNQKKFKLPSRLIAKKFLFRSIYCPHSIASRTAFAFSVDNEFKHIGGVRFWQRVIDAFYEKYEGINYYHQQLIREATTTGRLISETGRHYYFKPKQRKGEWEWPVSDIVNYPVQGFSGDLMSLARVSARRRLRGNEKILFINTVHDSLVLDVDMNLKESLPIVRTVRQVFKDIPNNYRKIYGKELLVPMACDCKVGINWLWTHKIDKA